MDKEAEERLRVREAKITATLKNLSVDEMINLARLAVGKMEPKQQTMARKMTMEELARVQLFALEFYGF